MPDEPKTRTTNSSKHWRLEWALVDEAVGSSASHAAQVREGICARESVPSAANRRFAFGQIKKEGEGTEDR